MTIPAPSSLGEFLRNEREKRGFSAEQVASSTKIGLRLLHALENDLYEELPAKPFVRGFVISYCRFLGISPNEVLTRFSRFLDEKSEERPKRDAGHSGYAFERKEGDQSRTWLWIVMGGLLVGGALVVVIAKPNFKRHHRVPVDKLRSSHGESPVPAAELASPSPVPSPSVAPASSPSPSPSPSPKPSMTVVPAPAAPAPSPSPRPSVTPSAAPSSLQARRPDPLLSGKDLLKEEIRVKVVIKAQQDMWVKFKVDDKDSNRIVLRAGVLLVLLAKDSVAIQSSNPSDAIITRSAGEPNALKAVGSPQSLDAMLKSKQGVAEDGRTLWVPAQASGIKGNPFAGQPAMAPPPPKAASSGSDDATPSE